MNAGYNASTRTHVTAAVKRAVAALLAAVLVLIVSGCQRAPGTNEDTLPMGTDTPPVALTPIETPTTVPTIEPTAAPTPEPVVTAEPTVEPSADPGIQSWDESGGIIIPVDTQTPDYSMAVYATVDPLATPFVALAKGMKGDPVRILQQGLAELGYYAGAVDGNFGTGTADAVASFQIANGLTPDGVAGSRTIRAMNALLTARSAPTYPIDTPVPMTPLPVMYTPLPTLEPTPPSVSDSSPYRTLRTGDTGDDVREMQDRLKALGYFTGTTNGIYASDTLLAVSLFQQASGLPMDGIAGSDTQRALFDSSASSSSIASVQTLEPVSASLYTPSPTPTAASAAAEMREGSAGPNVNALQSRLEELGYLTGSVSRGYYDPWTADAVRSFQQLNGLTADGVAGATTQARLMSDEAIASPIAGAQPAPVVAASTPPPGMATISPSTSILRVGSTGDEVWQLQQRLAELGYYPYSPDGMYSVQVAEAVQQFQSRNNLSPDGVAGTSTRYAIGSTAAVPAAAVSSGGSVGSFNIGTLQFGMRGPDVVLLQERLIQLGYLTGPATEYFGEQTRAAVTQFQQNNRLSADGIAGAKTLSMLSSNDAVNASGVVITPTPRPTVPATPRPTQKSDNTLRLGDTGTQVVALQERMSELGYMKGSADGNYGSATEDAVRSFQKANGITDTGAADEATQRRAYSAGAIPMSTPPAGNSSLSVLDNSAAEQAEQRITGALQSNLAGGGIAAISPQDTVTFYANGAYGGALYSEDSSNGSVSLSDKSVRFLHARDNTLYFATDSGVARYNTRTQKFDDLAATGYLKKMSAVGDVIYYLEGSALYRVRAGETARALADDVNDFCVDVQNSLLYIASSTNIRVVDESGRLISTIINTGAQQVLQCAGVLHVLKGGAIFRITAGNAELVIDADASWFGFYKTNLYYISGSALYVCKSNGTGVQTLDPGPAATVSFLAGYVCVGSASGGGMNRKVPAPQ